MCYFVAGYTYAAVKTRDAKKTNEQETGGGEHTDKGKWLTTWQYSMAFPAQYSISGTVILSSWYDVPVTGWTYEIYTKLRKTRQIIFDQAHKNHIYIFVCYKKNAYAYNFQNNLVG